MLTLPGANPRRFCGGLSRRNFLKQTSLLTASVATLGSASSLRAAKGPNEKVILGIIGFVKANNNPDKTAARRAFEAMMTMRKIDIATIEAALKDETINA